MDANLFLESLVPGDSLRLRDGTLKHIRTRDWTFFRRLRENRLLLIQEGKPLSIQVGDIDWEEYKFWRTEMREPGRKGDFSEGKSES